MTLFITNCILETQSITKAMVYIYIHIYINIYVYTDTYIHAKFQKPPKYMYIKRITHAHNNTAKSAKLNIRTANHHMERPTNRKLR